MSTTDRSPPGDVPVEIALIDDHGPRTTADLVGSLLARVATLHAVTGAQAVGSLVAGLGALGRRSAETTADGARLRETLRASRVAANGDDLWSRLGTGAALAASPPSPILADLRNDLALLLAHDLDAALADLDLIEPAEHIGALAEPEPIDCVDLVVGLWAYSSEIVSAVQALTDHADGADVGAPADDLTTGPMLR